MERKLKEMGDPLERLSQVIDFEMFRPELEDALLPKERKSNAGAKRYDVVMMFKLMVLQLYYNLSDEQAEFQIVDRMSFRRETGTRQSLYLTLITAAPLAENAHSDDIPVKLTMDALFG